MTLTVAGLALVASANLGLAQGTNTTFTFDSDSSISSFVNWWGVTTTFQWVSDDADENPDSGSVQYNVPFTGIKDDQFMTFFTIAGRWGWDNGTTIDASSYTNLSFDIKVDPSSSPRKDYSDFGVLEVGIVSYGWIASPAVGSVTLPLSATNGWMHFSLPISSGLSGLDTVVGFYLKMWSDGETTDALIFDLDNFEITQPTVTIVSTPTVSIAPAIPGLLLGTTATSGQYGRQSIYTKDDNFSWVGASGKVTYSVEIKDAPASSDFQTHIFFVPEDVAPYGAEDSSVDWNCTNLIWLNIQTGNAQLRYKTNSGSANSMLWNSDPANGAVGVLAILNCDSPVGVWTLTFENDTSITLTSPAGGTTNVSISAESAQLFANPLFIDYGVQANNTDLSGLGTTVKRIWTSNTTSVLDDSFSGDSLDTNNWGYAAQDSAGILVVPQDSEFWFKWTLPADSSASVLSAPSITGPWTDAGLTSVHQVDTQRKVVIPASMVTSGTKFFALGRRTFTKLQVIMPGETAAPGTTTGKTGTPDQQAVGTEFSVVINSVDDNWYPIKSTDTIHFTSTDETALLPDDIAMVGGTVTVKVAFNQYGTWTITASDVTDSTKKSGTSSVTEAQ